MPFAFNWVCQRLNYVRSTRTYQKVILQEKGQFRFVFLLDTLRPTSQASQIPYLPWPIDTCVSSYLLWWALAFGPLLTSSPSSKLASFILKFWRRKRSSFQWYPDQSDCVNYYKTIKYARKCLEIWLKSFEQIFPQLHLAIENCPSRWCFLGNCFTGCKPSRRSTTAAKR